MKNKIKTIRDLAAQFPEMYNYHYKWRQTESPELEKDIHEVIGWYGYKFKEDTEADYNDIKGYLNCEIVPIVQTEPIRTTKIF